MTMDGEEGMYTCCESISQNLNFKTSFAGYDPLWQVQVLQMAWWP